jgi:hypothetical protein
MVRILAGWCILWLVFAGLSCQMAEDVVDKVHKATERVQCATDMECCAMHGCPDGHV